MLNPNDFVDTLTNCRLNVLNMDTADTYIRLFCCDNVMRCIGPALSVNNAVRDATAAVFVSNKPNTYQVYLHITAGNSDVPAGMFSIHARADNRVFEIGIMLFEQFHHMGLAETTVKYVCLKLLMLYPDYQIVCRIDRTNIAAKTRAANLGFLQSDSIDRYILDRNSFTNI